MPWGEPENSGYSYLDSVEAKQHERQQEIEEKEYQKRKGQERERELEEERHEMDCRKCGKTVTRSTFCKICGWDQRKKPKEKYTIYYCPQHGQQNDGNYCRICGKSLQEKEEYR